MLHRHLYLDEHSKNLSRRQLLRLAGSGLIAGSLAPTLAACGSDSDTGAQSGGGPALGPVRLGLSSDPGSLSLVAAVDQGFFKKHGVADATYKLFPQSNDALLAAISGSLDIAGTISELSLVGTKAKGADILALCVVKKSGKQLALVGEGDINGPQDLIGKTVGMTRGVAAQYYQILYFEKYGLTGKAKVVNVQPPDTVAALARGDIQAFFGFEPWLAKAQQAVSGAHIIAYSSDGGVYSLTSSMSATRSWVQAHPQETVATLKAFKDGTDWLNQNRDAAIALGAKVYHLDEETVRNTIAVQDFVFQSPDSATSIFVDTANFINTQKIATIADPASFVSDLVDTDTYAKATT